MTHRVTIVARANRDVDKIYYWLAKRSRLGSLSWYQAFLDCLDKIAQSAASFPPALEAQQTGREIREVFFKTRQGKRYRIVFTIVANDAFVLRVRGPGQRQLRRRDIPDS